MQTAAKKSPPQENETMPLSKPDTNPHLDTADNDPCARDRMIAEAAYFLSERRGFSSGHELSDWLSAEAAIAGMAAPVHSPATPRLLT